MRTSITLLFYLLALASAAWAVPGIDDIRTLSGEDTTNLADDSKPQTLEEILTEVETLFRADRPLDARTKLLKALQVAPDDYRPHLLLGAYYLSEVGHFRLAYDYLRHAEKLFETKYGSDRTENLERTAWQQHAKLLYLLSEAELNLDQYQASLNTLDRFGKLYWDTWYPGTRAWVLMKLKRVDEAILAAQAGLIREAEQGRTYNILGILLSLKGNRDVALEAFARAIQTERALGPLGQAATPLNNSGEVYREIFKDDFAEAAWLQALQLKDGCDHVLPSLNLAILYIDQLRLFQAERVLEDFEACFQNNPLRSDTEHRALLALARGRIAMREGDSEKAVSLLQHAMEREQWFGKIGTNENDLRFAATVTTAQALRAREAALRDRVSEETWSRLKVFTERKWLLVRANWYERRAREIALDELEDFEDLFVRNTDTMVEYPTLGGVIRGFPVRAFGLRLQRILKRDLRAGARPFYELYRAENFLGQGRQQEGVRLLENAFSGFRPIDRLARAHAMTLLEVEKSRLQTSFFYRKSAEDTQASKERRQEIFSILPSHLRSYNLALPIQLEHITNPAVRNTVLNRIERELLRVRLEKVPDSPYRVLIQFKTASGAQPMLHLELRKGESLLAQASGNVALDGTGRSKVINTFIDSAFQHKADPPAEPVPALPGYSEKKENDGTE